jgi:hypothetical protein
METNETFNSVLEASVMHTGNVGSMLMDEVAHVNKCIDGCCEEIERLEKDMAGTTKWIAFVEDERERQGMEITFLKVRKVGSGDDQISNWVHKCEDLNQ